MANLTTQNFVTLVQNQVIAIQAGYRGLVDLTVGSILRSIVEANASVQLWLQGLILQLLATTRAATSSGTDLDTFVGDFGLTRLTAVKAGGTVTFSRFTSTSQVVVLVGATIQTNDGTQQYTVNLDTTNAAYNASLGGYVLAVAVSSVSVTVTAVTAGALGNAQAGQINTITSPISGVDTVTNAATFITGANAEIDTALRTRFVAFIANLSKATKNAIGYAITSVQLGVNYALVENVTYAGVTQLGYFYVVADDGTGTPPGSFITAVNNAVDVVRPFTSTFNVYSPVVVTAGVTMTLTIAAGYDPTATRAAVSAALSAYINALGLGNSLRYTRLAQIAYDTSAGVTNVASLLLNAGTVDVAATPKQTVKAASIVIS